VRGNVEKKRERISMDQISSTHGVTMYGMNDMMMLNGYKTIKHGEPGGGGVEIRIDAISRRGYNICTELEICKAIDGIANGEGYEARIQAVATDMARQIARLLKAKGVTVIDCINWDKGCLQALCTMQQ
jgi:hypothetical protein